MSKFILLFLLLILKVGANELPIQTEDVHNVNDNRLLEEQNSVTELQPIDPVFYCPGLHTNCSSHGFCKSDGTCDCDFGWTGKDCLTQYEKEYNLYVILFSILFAIVAVISAIQLFKLIKSEGCTIDIPNGLHLLFLIMAIERVIWLTVDPHTLKKKLNPVAENLIYGFGLYVILFSYLLLVMLWAITYRKASVERMNSWVLRNVKAIFTTLIVIFGIAELVLRIMWRRFPPSSESYVILISVYYFLMMCIALFAIFSFLYWGLRLYRNLIQFQSVNDQVRERLKRITVLTIGVTVICVIMVVTVALTFAIEITTYRFEYVVSFLGEQCIFRLLEVCLSLLILYGLRKSPSSSTSSNVPIAASASGGTASNPSTPQSLRRGGPYNGTNNNSPNIVYNALSNDKRPLRNSTNEKNALLMYDQNRVGYDTNR